jgi:hypothetical protein
MCSETYCDGDKYDAGTREEAALVETLPDGISSPRLIGVEGHLERN